MCYNDLNDRLHSNLIEVNMNQENIKLVCTICGSENILIDAWASWNPETQKPELHSTYENWHCVDCDGECNVDEVAI